MEEHSRARKEGREALVSSWFLLASVDEHLPATKLEIKFGFHLRMDLPGRRGVVSNSNIAVYRVSNLVKSYSHVTPRVP